VLQCVAVCCRVFDSGMQTDNIHALITTQCCSVLQCVAVCLIRVCGQTICMLLEQCPLKLIYVAATQVQQCPLKCICVPTQVHLCAHSSAFVCTLKCICVAPRTMRTPSLLTAFALEWALFLNAFVQCVAARCSVLHLSGHCFSMHLCGGCKRRQQTRISFDNRRSPLLRVAVCCSAMQCVTVRCSALQCVAVCCSVLQCVAVCSSVIQCVQECCSVLQLVPACSSVHQCTPLHTSMLKSVPVCCSVLQCVPVSGA